MKAWDAHSQAFLICFRFYQNSEIICGFPFRGCEISREALAKVKREFTIFKTKMKILFLFKSSYISIRLFYKALL